MAFENKLMARASTSFSDGQTAVQWTYGPSLTDNLSTITASAYFNEWKNQINKDDYIYVVGTDGQDIRAFTSVQGVTPVTVAPFITAGDIADGSITTSKLADLAVTTAKIADLAVSEAKISSNAVTTGKIADSTIIQAKLQPNSLDGTVISSLVIDSGIGHIPVMFRIDMPGGATNNKDIVMSHKVLITDFWIVNGAAGTTSDTITLQNVTLAFSSAVSIDVADNIITRAPSIIIPNALIEASANLRIVQTDGSGSDSPAVSVFVVGFRAV